MKTTPSSHRPSNRQTLAADLRDEFARQWVSAECSSARQFYGKYANEDWDDEIRTAIAYEEFCLRIQAGESLDIGSYCDQYPEIRAELESLLDCHCGLSDELDPLDSCLPEFPAVGGVFLGYRLRRILGEGAFARVYLAEQPNMNRPVALKISGQDVSEARRHGKLQHENIVSAYTFATDEEQKLSAICMPYLGSATLLDVLDLVFADGRIPVTAHEIVDAAREREIHGPTLESAGQAEETLQEGNYVDGVVHLGTRICDALSLMHQQGILHLDLKPSNVLITPSGRPMLMDFNLSVDANEERTQVGGTLPYMSPEQVRQVYFEHSMQIDERSDIYALGVLLYQMLTGRLPFSPRCDDHQPAVSSAKTHLSRQASAPLAIRTLNQSVPFSVAQVVQQCLHSDPASRPQSADELKAQLDSSLNPVSTVTSWVCHQPIKAIGFSAAILAVAAIGFSIVLLSPSRSDLLMREAEALVQQGEFEQAEEKLSDLIDSNPLHPSARALRTAVIKQQARQYLEAGIAAHENGDDERASQLLGKAFAGSSSRFQRFIVDRGDRRMTVSADRESATILLFKGYN